MMFTIEFIRIRAGEKAHATLDRVLQTATDLDAVKVRAKSMFDTLNTCRSHLMRCGSWMRADGSSLYGRQEMTHPLRKANRPEAGSRGRKRTHAA